jgi:hypothetical protein
VYYPAYNSWTVWTGLNVGCWATKDVSGKETLFFGDATDGKVYKWGTAFDDNGTAISLTEETKDEVFEQPLIQKTGGWVEVEALAASEASSLTISGAVDGGEYAALGTMNLYAGTSPTLPVTLPFNLVGVGKVRQRFPLDQFGEYRNIKIKVTHTTKNTEDVKYYAISLTTFPENLDDEDTE